MKASAKVLLIFAGVVVIIVIIAGLLIFHPWRPTQKSTATNNSELSRTPVSKVTGIWSGSYTVTAPKECVSYAGYWNAVLSEANGVITGSYISDTGSKGDVNGNLNGSNVSWSITGSGGDSFTGSITGTNINGNFLSVICPGTSTQTSGTFQGVLSKN